MTSSGKGSNTKSGPGGHPGGKSVVPHAMKGGRGSGGSSKQVALGKLQKMPASPGTGKGTVGLGVKKSPKNT